MNRLRADLLLLVASFIWGTAFIAQKIANETLGTFSFVGIRFFLSAVALLPLAAIEAQKGEKSLSAKDFGIALVLGLSLFAATSLQQFGLRTTSATHGGFLTSLYVVFVPVVVWLLRREKPSLIVGLACGVSVLGAWLLAGTGSAPWVVGDLYVLLADAAWALGIVLIPVFLSRHARPYLLSFIQFCITAVLGVSASLAFEQTTAQALLVAFPAILYAGLLSGGVAFTMQIFAQKYAPPTEASLIMAMESVFAALAGMALLGERLSTVALVGCGLILLGIVFSETGPRILQRITRRY